MITHSSVFDGLWVHHCITKDDYMCTTLLECPLCGTTHERYSKAQLLKAQRLDAKLWNPPLLENRANDQK